MSPIRARTDSESTKYERGWKVTEMMPEFSLGSLTKRDNLVIGRTRSELNHRIARFLNPSKSDDEVVAEFGVKLVDKDMWNAREARRSVGMQDIDKYIREEAFRPFDS